MSRASGRRRVRSQPIPTPRSTRPSKSCMTRWPTRSAQVTAKLSPNDTPGQGGDTSALPHHPEKRGLQPMYSGPVVDCDVHHARNTDAELIEYLSPGWRQYVTDRGPAGNVTLAVQDGFPNPPGFMRADRDPKEGGERGSDCATMGDQLLAGSGVRCVIPTFGDRGHAK